MRSTPRPWPGCGRRAPPARELAWAQVLETRRSLPATMVLGQALPGFVLDIDATIVAAHSEKESAAATWKHTFGYHPLLCFLDATGEALAGMLRPGNAGSNTAADHITVLDQALHQIPDAHRYGSPILIRSDSAGSSHEFLAHIRSLREHGLHTQFSVGVAITGPIRTAITVTADWVPALDGDGSLRDGAQVVELTDQPGSNPAHGRFCGRDITHDLARIMDGAPTTPRREHDRQRSLRPEQAQRLLQQQRASRRHQRLTRRIKDKARTYATLHLRSAFLLGNLETSQSQECLAGQALPCITGRCRPLPHETPRLA